MDTITVGIVKLICGAQQVAEGVLRLYARRGAVLATRILENNGETFETNLAQVPNVIDGGSVLVHKDDDLGRRDRVRVDVDRHLGFTGVDLGTTDGVQNTIIY